MLSTNGRKERTTRPGETRMAWVAKNLGQRAPGILLGLLGILLVLVLRSFGVLEGAELSVHDRFLRLHSGQAKGPSPVVAVSIGEEEFDRYGFPIPDGVLAKALRQLGVSGTSAIGVDLYRPGPSSDNAEALAGWRELGDVVSGNRRIVMAELLPSSEEAGAQAPIFADRATQVGFNDLLIDRGRVVRRGYMIDWDEAGDARLSLSLRLALLHLAKDGIGLGPDESNPDWVRLGETPIPPLETDFGAYADLDAGGYQFLLDFARPDEAFETVTLTNLVEGNVPSERLDGRIAVVGTDSVTVKDDFNAPFAAGQAVKGYRLHGHIVDQLVRMARGVSVPAVDWQEGFELAWIIGWGLSGIALSLWIGTLGWAVPGLIIGVAALVFETSTLFSNGTWVPTVAPAAAWLSAGGLALGDRARREARAQTQAIGLFRQFASRKVADELWRQRDEFMEGGRPKPQRVVLTAMLSDLKGYTAAAEKMEPDALMAWIDSYMEAMTRVIESHDGQVDDYVGDGIKANFGVPIPSETEEEISADACHAVRCAIEMGETLERLNTEWARKGWPTGRQRIGLFTGPAVVGAIGNESRRKYTSVGDTINTAARLESIAGPLDFDQEDSLQRILIGASTRRAVGEAFDIEDLGQHAVKGKVEPLDVYRVKGARRSHSEEEAT